MTHFDQVITQHWQLDQDAKLYDVTHLPCHAARYTPEAAETPCCPDEVQPAVFPAAPGVAMPPVKGCHKKSTPYFL